jgi:hypothetical protein
MNKLNTAALAYANVLVQYHELRVHCETSTLREDKQALRDAYDQLYAAQNQLDSVAQECALETTL